ncbi:FAD-binding protein [Rhizobium sp. CF080]|uniref:FAD-binding protein n=1 Tax=Rhizobium sp. (strain CF080) TaxID=1144310 RepID=UPI001FD9C075|nr:FAD-binding protein [Rhizobium sp. CF080]
MVVGSGAAGLTAALTGLLAGLKVAVIEKLDVIGGTSARSSGTVWVPDNHFMHMAGFSGERQSAGEYLAALTGEDGDSAMWRTFLANAPRMIEDLNTSAGIAFRPYEAAPDYRQDKPGAASGWRALEPVAFDGRELGGDFYRLAWPIRELMLFGGLMVTRGEAAMLLNAERSLSAIGLGMRLVGRYLLDRIKYRRGTRLVLGNALVARLLKAVVDRGGMVSTGVTPLRLLVEGGVVRGITVRNGEAAEDIRARAAVILAGGGFPANGEWRSLYLPAPTPEHTPASPGCDGSTIRIALEMGAALGRQGKDNALWFPSSVAGRHDGSLVVYPHIVLDRAKPGLIAVNHRGVRFVNEAVSYHEFVRGMYAADGEHPAIPAWLICDRHFIRRYGLGLIRPRALSLRHHVASGYLKRGRSIEALADEIRVPAEQLSLTIARANEFADTGVDLDFGKGGSLYDRSNGDPLVKPNPCLGRIENGPFYAVAVYPTPLGTSLGLLTNHDAQVLNADGSPIRGLYVCGNDMHSVFAGEYPGAGAQLGQAMTFAWIAARHAAARTGATSISDIIREEKAI